MAGFTFRLWHFGPQKAQESRSGGDGTCMSLVLWDVATPVVCHLAGRMEHQGLLLLTLLVPHIRGLILCMYGVAGGKWARSSLSGSESHVLKMPIDV